MIARFPLCSHSIPMRIVISFSLLFYFIFGGLFGFIFPQNLYAGRPHKVWSRHRCAICRWHSTMKSGGTEQKPYICFFFLFLHFFHFIEHPHTSLIWFFGLAYLTITGIVHLLECLCLYASVSMHFIHELFIVIPFRRNAILQD